ncbi:efflux RND transporter periplasmic adaptor subunit [uncultured Parabacteroides sp.]|uniref:efflux RND transporter periplasmic adaptor subunit n=1 Tax=uncultured Parabacteroides sp. TaxID=512312 RepID=UPI0025F584A9|nr:efflux RND transporter periplasmic adaptor subunit [uncultured Parabacteroides sp.]
MNGKLIPVFASIAVLMSCSQPPVKEHGPRPVKLTEVVSLNVVEKSFSGVVSPDQFSDLAFKMSGPLISLNVEEGQKVRTGQIVAEMDPQDFKWDFEAKKASFQTAQAQLQRAERLLAKQAISQQEYETTKASYSNAQAAFENSQNTLEQTKLRAPFDGFIQKKYVENYQKVQMGQGIVCLINPNKLQIQFTMPETNITYFSTPYTIYVEFDNYKGLRFKAKVKEYVEASPDGSGVPVFLYIDDPAFDLNKYKVAVGFSCRVVLNIESQSFNEGAVLIPLSAIVADEANSSDKFVFVFNPQTQQVERRKITVRELVGKDNVIILQGLKAGERVVTAGATRLVDGQQVKVLTD